MRERRFVRELLESKQRILVLSFVVGVVFLFLVIRLWHLQILNTDDYHAMSENNRLRFVPVAASRGAILDRSGIVLVSNPSVPAQDFKGLMNYLKANSGKLSFASYGAGTASHYDGVILAQREKLDMVHSPFAGSPPALQMVMGGQIPIMFDGSVTSTPMVLGGKLKVYAVSGKTRLPKLPQTPTFTELGYPELDFSNWLGFVASSKMSPELADKINAAIAKAAASPKVRERLLGAGFEIPAPQSAAELALSMRDDFKRNGDIVKTFNIKLN